MYQKSPLYSSDLSLTRQVLLTAKICASCPPLSFQEFIWQKVEKLLFVMGFERHVYIELLGLMTELIYHWNKVTYTYCNFEQNRVKE